jgi:hypothetical protein
MVRSLVLAAALGLGLANQGLSATVFSDDFSQDATGQKVTELVNFNVEGNVDVVANKTFKITTPGGKVIDLDGFRGAGTLTSKKSFAFKTGDRVTLNILIGGAQRQGADDSLFVAFSFADAIDVFDWTVSGFRNAIEGDVATISGIGTGVSNYASTTPFAMSRMSFRAGNAGSLTFSIGTDSKDRIGPLLAGVSLDITPAAVPLPATGAFLLLGLGLFGALRRKRLQA